MENVNNNIEHDYSSKSSPLEIRLSVNSVYSAPVFKETKNKKWVDYVDNEKNQFPDELIKYKNNSALHGSIIEALIYRIKGNGFTYDTSSNKASATQKFIEEIDANELLSRVSADHVLFGGFSIATVWGVDYKKITNIEHVDFSKVRSSIVDPSTGKVPGYFYAWDWNTQRPQNVMFIPVFSEDTAKENAEKYKKLQEQFDLSNDNLKLIEKWFQEPTTQLLYYKPYRAGSFYYPYPKYIGGINAIKTMIMADQYGINSMENGMAVDYIINMIGQYTDEDKKKESAAVLKQVTDPKRKRWPLIVFSPTAEQKVEIKSISAPGQDKNYTAIHDNSEQEILNAHSITSPLLVGIKTPGQLGGSEELQDAENLLYETAVRPIQLEILKVMNSIMKINDLEILDIEKITLFSTSEANNEIKTENK